MACCATAPNTPGHRAPQHRVCCCCPDAQHQRCGAGAHALEQARLVASQRLVVPVAVLLQRGLARALLQRQQRSRLLLGRALGLQRWELFSYAPSMG